MSDLSITGEVVVTSEKAEAAFTRVGEAAQGMANEVASSAGLAGQAVDKIGDGAGQSAEKFTRAEARMSQAIKKSTTELELLGKTASQRFEFNIADKGLDPTKFEPMLQKLRETESLALRAQTAGTSSLDKIGVSAAQNAAAMRQVPAQFTDIVTSLQGGQKPMTVLLQQGGQLKDMFGGAGNAARAMGSYVLGLINPFTITAAAAGVVVLAFAQGQKESQAYRQALIETGNASGVTATQLAAMAASVSASSKITQGAAAEALATLAGSNNIASGSFERIAGIAAQLQSVTGASVGATVKQFEELGKSPVEASLKLNESTHFLTASVYEQIRALAEQGKTTEAAALAQNTYASVMEQRIPQLQANLGYVEKAWAAIAKEAKGAWDSMLNIGRPSDPVAGANKALEAAQAALDRARDKSANGGLRDTSKDNADANITRLERVIAARQQEVALLGKGAAYEAQSAAYQKIAADQMDAQAKLRKMSDQYLSNEVRMVKEIAAAREAAKDAPQNADNTKLLNATIAGIREKYAGEGPRTALDGIIRQLEEQQMVITQAEQRASKTLAAQHSAQLVDDADFYAKKRDMALQSVGEQQAIINAEIAAVARSGIKSGDKTKEIERYNGDLAKLRQQDLGIESEYSDSLYAINQKNLKIQDDYISALGKAGAADAKRLDGAIASQREHNAEIGLTKEQIEAYKRTVEDAGTAELQVQEQAISALLERNQALVDYGDTLGLIGGKAKEIYEEERKKLQYQIAKRKQLAALYSDGSAREASSAASKASTEEWKRGWAETDRIAREAFTSWAEGGTSAAEAVGKALKKALLSAIYEATFKPLVLQIYTSVVGSNPGASGAGGIMSTLGSMASGKSDETGIAGTILASAGLFGKGFSAGLGAVFGESGTLGALSAGTTAIGAGNLAGGFGTLAGAAAPWIAGAMALKGLTDYSVKSDGSALVANIGSKGLSGQVARRDDFTQSSSGIFSGGTTHNSDWSRAGDAVDSYIDTVTKSASNSVRLYAAALGLPVDAIDGFSKQIEASIAGLNPEQQKAAIDKAVSGFLDEMVSSAYGTPLAGLSKSGETSSQTLQRLAVDLSTVNSGLQQLGMAVLPIGLDSAKTAAGLTDAFGGLDKMQSAVGSYYEKFYSDSERAAQGFASLQAQFDALGVSIPTNREGFRQLVASIDISTESGQRMAAAVLGLAPAFDTAASAAQAAAAKMASVIADYASSGEVRAFQVDQIQRALADSGVVLTSDQIANATRSDARALYEQLVASGNSSGAAAVLDQAKAFAAITQPTQSAVGGSSGGGGGGGGSSASDAAAQSINQAWQSITDGIWDEVKRIRNLLAGTGPEAYAAAQAKFAITTAQARAGDQDSAKSLPEVSRILQELAQQNAQSSVELRVMQAKSAASLTETASILALKFGLTVPKFSAGTNYTQEGLAYLHEGEAVVPRAYNPAAGANLGGGSDLINAVRSLSSRLDVIEANTRAGALHAAVTARVLKRVTPGGDAIETRTAAA